ncbi:MAG: MarR family transcriptional regulator [Anaerosomatales bacterium]|nr:MarR family transcriptional regulator [Anaerosomatales bacterium]
MNVLTDSNGCCDSRAASGPAFDPLETLDPNTLGVFRALKRVMMLYRQHAFRAFSEVGVHPGQAACLFALRGEEGLSQRELARRLFVSAPTVTGIVQKMERADLVERRPDPHDQRLMRIRLSERGREVAAALAEAFASQAEAMFAGFTPEELAELSRLLSRVGENLAGALGSSAAIDGDTADEE